MDNTKAGTACPVEPKKYETLAAPRRAFLLWFAKNLSICDFEARLISKGAAIFDAGANDAISGAVSGWIDKKPSRQPCGPGDHLAGPERAFFIVPQIKKRVFAAEALALLDAGRLAVEIQLSADLDEFGDAKKAELPGIVAHVFNRNRRKTPSGRIGV